MKTFLTIFFLFLPLFAQTVMLPKDNLYYKIDLLDLPSGGWIASNLSNDLIDIVTNEERGMLQVLAKKSSGTAVVEVVVVDDEEVKTHYLQFDLQDARDPFSFFFDDMDTKIQPIITQLADGAKVLKKDGRYYYEGVKNGTFVVGYLTKTKEFVKKQIAVTDRGLVAFPTIIDVVAGRDQELEFEAVFSPYISVLDDSILGKTVVKNGKILFESDDMLFGENRVILSVEDGSTVAIKLRVTKDKTNIKLPKNSKKISTKSTDKYIGRVAGKKFELIADHKDKLLLKFDKKSFLLPIDSWIDFTDQGFVIKSGDFDLNISTNGLIVADQRSRANVSLDRFDLKLLSTDAFFLTSSKISLVADQGGFRLFTSDKKHLPILPTSSDLNITRGGVDAVVSLISDDVLLPFGWNYGTLDDKILTLQAIFGKPKATLKYSFDSNSSHIEYAGSTYESELLKEEQKTIALANSWNSFGGSGFAFVENLQASKLIRADQDTKNHSWKQYEPAIKHDLNSLFFIDSGGAYFAKSDKRELEMGVVPHAPIWQKRGGFVGVPDFTALSLELDSKCQLFDEKREEISYYKDGAVYLLRCDQ